MEGAVTPFHQRRHIRSLIRNRFFLSGLIGSIAGTALLSGCFALRSPAGGSLATFSPPRTLRTSDIALLSEYHIEPVATELTFPTGVAFDAAGRPYLVESGYAYGEVLTTPRLLRIEPGGKTTVIAAGESNGPWTGVAFHQGVFYVSEGGTLRGGRILRITSDGTTEGLHEKMQTTSSARRRRPGARDQ